MAEIRVRLGQGRNAYFDPISRVYLQQYFIRETTIPDGTNLTNIQNAITSGALELVSGVLPPPVNIGGGGLTAEDRAQITAIERQGFQNLLERSAEFTVSRWAIWDGFATSTRIQDTADHWEWSTQFSNYGGYVYPTNEQVISNTLYGSGFTKAYPPIEIQSTVTGPIRQTFSVKYGGDVHDIGVAIKRASDADFAAMGHLKFSLYDMTSGEPVLLTERICDKTNIWWAAGVIKDVTIAFDAIVLTPWTLYMFQIEAQGTAMGPSAPYEFAVFSRIDEPDYTTWDYPDGNLSVYDPATVTWADDYAKDLQFELRITQPEQPSYTIRTGFQNAPFLSTATQYLVHTHEDFNRLGWSPLPEPHVFQVDIFWGSVGAWTTITPGTWLDLPPSNNGAAFVLQFTMSKLAILQGWLLAWR